ncbi:MAG: ATP phosphoribosyltransferase regulatory subunit [Clostridiales bacterium]|nr:ATP phosphoribosyltransferase regulatory subunit [Clostridiales bacterium]
MADFKGILRNDEKYIFGLRQLYESYGYKQFSMSKFEEYDFYLENKSFLKSESIITFNDPMTGKLLALKPDITLSIVKERIDSDFPDKFYYCENVYRASGTTKEIKESMQVGVEYVGELDRYSTCEVISLAAKSLETITPDYLLCVSHMGLVTALLDETDLSYSKKEKLIKLIATRSAHEIKLLCDNNGVDPSLTDKIVALASFFGDFEATLDEVKAIAPSDAARDAVNELDSLYKIMKSAGCSDKLRLDFSIMNDMSYYNGIIFQGFVDGLPINVLSGGRYDNLLRKLKKRSDAIGFAVYLDLLERYRESEKEFDVDIFIVYDDESDASFLSGEVRRLTKEGKSVRAEKHLNSDVKYRELYFVRDGRLVKNA